MARLFGCLINVEAEEEGGGGGGGGEGGCNSIAGEVSRSVMQPNGEAMSLSVGSPPLIERENNPYLRFLESKPDSGSAPMDLESDLHNCFIDFFDREPYEVDEFQTAGSNQRPSPCDFDIWGGDDMEEDKIELGLGIGSGSEGFTERHHLDFRSQVTSLLSPEEGGEEEDIEEEDSDSEEGEEEEDSEEEEYGEEPGMIARPPASKSVVDGLPLVEFTWQELRSGNIVCAICTNDILVEEKVNRLPCRHYYHGDCIIPWLGITNTCPVCRYELPTDDLQYEKNRRSQSQVFR